MTSRHLGFHKYKCNVHLPAAYSADILSGSRNSYAWHFYYMAKNDCVYGCYITEKKTSFQVQKILNLMFLHISKTKTNANVDRKNNVWAFFRYRFEKPPFSPILTRNRAFSKTSVSIWAFEGFSYRNVSLKIGRSFMLKITLFDFFWWLSY